MVIATHTAVGFPCIGNITGQVYQETELKLTSAIDAICTNCQNGVTLFFLISAMSLTLGLNRKVAYSLSAYAKRRFFRIAPMFYVGIALYTAIRSFVPNSYDATHTGYVEIGETIVFMHTWTINAFNSVVPGDWSIGTEASFYLLLPVLIFLTQNAPKRCMILIVALLALKAFEAHEMQGENFLRMRGFTTYLVLFAYGIFLASIVNSQPPFRIPALAGPAMMMLTIFALPLLGIDNVGVVGICFAFAIYLLHHRDSALITNPLLIKIGQWSFSGYILHFAVMMPCFWVTSLLMSSRGDAFLAIYMPMVIVVTCFLSAITHRWIEQPFIDFAHRQTAPRDRTIIETTIT